MKIGQYRRIKGHLTEQETPCSTVVNVPCIQFSILHQSLHIQALDTVLHCHLHGAGPGFSSNFLVSRLALALMAAVHDVERRINDGGEFLLGIPNEACPCRLSAQRNCPVGPLHHDLPINATKANAAAVAQT